MQSGEKSGIFFLCPVENRYVMGQMLVSLSAVAISAEWNFTELINAAFQKEALKHVH